LAELGYYTLAKSLFEDCLKKINGDKKIECELEAVTDKVNC